MSEAIASSSPALRGGVSIEETAKADAPAAGLAAQAAAPSPVVGTEEQASPGTGSGSGSGTDHGNGSGNGDGNGAAAVNAAAVDPVLSMMPPPPTAEDLDPERPNQRYIVGCLGDMDEAKRRWRLSLEWRREEGIDNILDEPQQYFDLIKQCYPHYYCKTGRSGDPVYYERSGQVDQPRMRAAGCHVPELVRHYIHSTEFLFRVLHPREDAKTITVFDVQGVGVGDLVGDALAFLRRSAHLIQEHYVERSAVIIIANAPSWFSLLWKIIKPMVNERTRKKIRIVKAGKETTEAIAEFVAPENIPACYGGQLRFGDGSDPDSCRWHSPEEQALRAFVHAVNRKHGVESRMS